MTEYTNRGLINTPLVNEVTMKMEFLSIAFRMVVVRFNYSKLKKNYFIDNSVSFSMLLREQQNTKKNPYQRNVNDLNLIFPEIFYGLQTHTL